MINVYNLHPYLSDDKEICNNFVNDNINVEPDLDNDLEIDIIVPVNSNISGATKAEIPEWLYNLNFITAFQYFCYFTMFTFRKNQISDALSLTTVMDFKLCL